MTKKKEQAAVDFIPETRAKTTATAESSKALSLVPILQSEIEEMMVADGPSLQMADELLGRIRLARKSWGAVWTRIQEKTVKPIRDGLEELYKLNRDVDGPYERLEKAIKAKMDAYRLEESRRSQAAETERRRIAEEAERKRITAETAATPQMRGRLAAAADRLTEQAAAVEDVTPTTTLHSSSRKVEKPRVPDLKTLCAAIGRGDIPTDAVLVNQRYLDQWFKDEPETVRELDPIIEVHEDIRTVGR